MSRAQPKSSPTDEYARRIALAIAKGRPPPFSADLDRYCESSPREIFAAFAGAARHMPPAGKDEALAIGYLFVLQQLLEHLRYRTDRGYADAAKLIADFQAEVVARVEAGQVDCAHARLGGRGAAPVENPCIAGACRGIGEARARSGRGRTASDRTSAPLSPACSKPATGDPFMAVGSLIESSHAMPAETRGALAGALALAGIPEARAAAVLFLLDPNSAVRRAAAAALAQVAASLTPTEIRRLIAMRNWRPENERAEVDAIIRKARAAGIDCAQWDGGQHRDNCRHQHRRRRSARIPADIAGRTEETDIVDPDQRRDRRCLERRAGIAPPDRGEPGRRRDGCPYACRIPIISRPHRWRTNWRSAQRNGKRRRSACSRSPRRSAAPIGNPRAWPSVKRSPG